MTDDIFHQGSADLTSPLPGGALLPLQGLPGAPSNADLGSATGMLVPDVRTDLRFSNFPPDLYDLTADTHLVRFLRSVIGDAGSGQVRKRSLLARLQSVLTSTHFFDLDGFYGAIFGASRLPSEILPVDPMVSVGSPDEWDDVAVSDAHYRERIAALARAIALGATVPGLLAAAEAITGVPCDLYETWRLIDLYGSAAQGGRSWDQVWNPIAVTGAYPTWASINGQTWSQISNAIVIGRSLTNSRHEVIIKPLRVYSGDPVAQQQQLLDEISLTRVLTILKPAGVLLTVDTTGLAMHLSTPMSSVASDSNYWEIIAKVTPRAELIGLASNPYPSSDIYQSLNGVGSVPPTPRPLPGPPLSQKQGEDWYHNMGIVNVTSYGMVVSSSVGIDQPGVGAQTLIPDWERIVKQDGTETDFTPSRGIADPRTTLAARSAGDGVMVAHPYSGSRMVVTPL